jgi:hypothetical protein
MTQETLGEKFVPIQIDPTKSPRGHVWDRTRASAGRCRRITALATGAEVNNCEGVAVCIQA